MQRGTTTTLATGGCHCGAVRFEVLADPAGGEPEVIECNCSMCTRLGFLHLIVPPERFVLLRGQQALVSYRFGTRTAEHLFCGTCGVKPFYRPRSHPDGYSCNVRCLDDRSWLERPRRSFDGERWEQSIEALRAPPAGPRAKAAPVARLVTQADVPRVASFLERHVETSLFLLDNLEKRGHRLGEQPNSGNFQLLEEAGEIVAVFMLARRGNLLVQAGERHELGGEIARLGLEQAERDGLSLGGVLGPWPTARAVFDRVAARPGFVTTLVSREPVFALDLARVAKAEGSARLLEERDFDAFVVLNEAYCAEENLPPPPR